MSFSPASIRRFLDSSFTGRATTLSELLQNARRAGASYVDVTYTNDVLTFEDDGCGIDSAHILLTPGQSGWDEQTMKDDDPFGLGFRAALLNCDYVAVSSKFGCFGSETEALLDGADPVIETGDFVTTRISMHRPKIKDIRDHLVSMAAAFPIPVIYNGSQINNPDFWVTVADTPQYTLRHKKDLDNLVGYSRVAVTVQHLPIKVPGRLVHPLIACDHRYDYSGAQWTLEMKGVEARMPDRDCLRNEEEAMPLDILPELLSYISRLDVNQHRTWLTAVARIDKALQAELAAVHGLHRETVSEWRGFDEGSPGVMLEGERSLYHERDAFSFKGDPDYRNVDVSYSGDDRDMAAKTWLSAMEDHYTPASRISHPKMPDLELTFEVEAVGEVRLDVANFYCRERLILCDSFKITPRYRDDDGNLVYELESYDGADYLRDWENDVLWLTSVDYLYELAHCYEDHVGDDGYCWDSDAISEYVTQARSRIELTLEGTAALQKMIDRDLSAVPPECLKVHETDMGRGRGAVLTDEDGTLLDEGVQRFVKQWPRAAAAIAKALADQEAPKSGEA